MTSITMIGFGEAGRAFVCGWKKRAGRMTAYDVKAGDPAMQGAADKAGVTCFEVPAPALEGADLAFSLVTADNALEAAQTAAPFLTPGILWFDGNSCAPGTKRKAAEVIEAAGGYYVDLAIMAPVYPRLHRTPALVAGPHVKRALETLVALDMDVAVAGPDVGDASSIKMLRSVVIKGMEAITAECLLAARRAGVEEQVLAFLQASDPGWDWTARGSYNLERMMVHGARRAAEMREVANTLRDLGLPDRMAAAAAEWQDQLGTLHLDGGPDVLTDRTDRILAKL